MDARLIDVQFGPGGVPWATFADGYVPPGRKLEVGEGLVATLDFPGRPAPR